VWLGVKLVRSSGSLDTVGEAPRPRGGFFWQGFIVLMSNPKALVLFGAFFPQFIDPAGDYVAQVMVLGVTAMAVAFVFDTAYAVLAGRAGAMLSKKRVQLVSRLSGACLIGGGVWLALQRSR
jgi:threonine/homoserine/homoserine lactone efflux protein